MKYALIIVAVALVIGTVTAVVFFVNDDNASETILNSSIVNNSLVNVDTNVNTNTNSSEVEVVEEQEGWKYFVNYKDTRDVIVDNDTTWIGTYGGVIKINTSINNRENITVANGLSSDVVTSLDLDSINNELWVGAQGGISKFDSNSLELIETYESSQDEVHTSVFYDRTEGLYSASNIELKRDPYTRILWAGTFKALSEYDEVTNSWTSYGKGAGINLSGVNCVEFTEDSVWIFVNSNGYTVGGIFSLDKATREWKHYGVTEGLLLSSASMVISSDGETVLASGRPHDWKSAAESRESDIYGISYGEETWHKVVALTEAIGQNDKVRSMKYENGYFILDVLSGFTNDRKETEIRYSLEDDEIIVDSSEKLTLAEQYSLYLNYPGESKILYETDGNLLWLSGLTTFNPMTDVFDRSVYEAFENNDEINTDPPDFYFSDCNQWNDSQTNLYVEDYSQGMGGYSGGIYVYNQESGVIEQFMGNDDWDALRSNGQITHCDDENLIFLSKEGILYYDVESGEERIVSTNFNSPEGYYYFANSDKENIWFWSETGVLGKYDIGTESFTYLTIPGDYANISSLELIDIDNDSLWLYVVSRSDRYLKLIKFNTSTNQISEYDLSSIISSSGLDKGPKSLTVHNGDVWMANQEDFFWKQKNSENFTVLPSNLVSKMMAGSNTSMYNIKMISLDSSIWFSASGGMWGKFD